MAGPGHLPRLEQWIAEDEQRAARLALLLDVSPERLAALRALQQAWTEELRAKAAAATGIETAELFQADPAVTWLTDAAVTQGHPRRVEDPATLRKLSALLRPRAQAC